MDLYKIRLMSALRLSGRPRDKNAPLTITKVIETASQVASSVKYDTKATKYHAIHKKPQELKTAESEARNSQAGTEERKVKRRREKALRRQWKAKCLQSQN